MDETAILYSMPLLRTLEQRGSRSVMIRKILDTSKRLTAAVTVGADGTKYPLFLILKGLQLFCNIIGHRTGRISQEISSLADASCHIYSNENAWMTSNLFDLYFEKVLLFPKQ
jgi:hypothetical protein